MCIERHSLQSLPSSPRAADRIRRRRSPSSIDWSQRDRFEGLLAGDARRREREPGVAGLLARRVSSAATDHSIHPANGCELQRHFLWRVMDQSLPGIRDHERYARRANHRTLVGCRVPRLDQDVARLQRRDDARAKRRDRLGTHVDFLPKERVLRHSDVETKRKRPVANATGLLAVINPGSDLLSHAVSHAVPSAVESLTSVFGMGTGVTPLL
jgi:hypothetical protein